MNIIVTNKGLEQTSANELKTFSIEAKDVQPGLVFFDSTPEELAKITYLGRTFEKTLFVIAQYPFANQEELLAKLPNLSEYITGSFHVECDREGEHDFNSFEIQNELDKTIQKQTAKEIKHKHPDVPLFAIIRGDQFYLGIDYAGLDLAKRDYRIFLGRESIRGNIAAGLLHIGDYQSQHTLLDPFCHHGEIIIEAALLARNISVNKHLKNKLYCMKQHSLDQHDAPRDAHGTIHCLDPHFGHVNAARKNAKIAGIVKDITFSRMQLEWLDTKFEHGSIDRIITLPQQPTEERKLINFYDDLFRTAKLLLTENGTLVLCMKRHPDVPKKNKTMTLEHEQIIMQGQEQLTVLVYKKK